MPPTTPALSRPDYGLPRSHEAFAWANRVIPGGVNSPARAFGAVGGEPPFIERAHGAYLHDIDGHTYIDYIGSWGQMILGHAEPRVNAAVSEDSNTLVASGRMCPCNRKTGGLPTVRCRSLARWVTTVWSSLSISSVPIALESLRGVDGTCRV